MKHCFMAQSKFSFPYGSFAGVFGSQPTHYFSLCSLAVFLSLSWKSAYILPLCNGTEEPHLFVFSRFSILTDHCVLFHLWQLRVIILLSAATSFLWQTIQMSITLCLTDVEFKSWLSLLFYRYANVPAQCRCSNTELVMFSAILMSLAGKPAVAFVKLKVEWWLSLRALQNNIPANLLTLQRRREEGSWCKISLWRSEDFFSFLL